MGPGQEVTRYCLSSELLDYYVHYVQGTYVPCLQEQGVQCPYHTANGPRLVYQASLAVFDAVAKEIQVAGLTQGCIEKSVGLETRTDLAGRRLVLGRRPGGINAPMYVSVSKEVELPLDKEKIVPSETLWGVLLNIWGVELVYDQGETPEPERKEK